MAVLVSTLRDESGPGIVQDQFGSIEELRTKFKGLSLDQKDSVWEETWPMHAIDGISAVHERVRSFNMDEQVTLTSSSQLRRWNRPDRSERAFIVVIAKCQPVK